jgi:ubiquinol-cytochrome c reductase cytochrome b subunit
MSNSTYNISFDNAYLNSFYSFFKSHVVDYKAPLHLNIHYNFGFILGIVFVIQILTGLFLAMHYVPTTELAFISVELINRDVNHGWLIRNIHSNGASLIFFCMYLHMLRGVYYAISKDVWLSGFIIFLLTMATAFLGYVLPWGQMSYWGATVICNLFSVIPFVGSDLVILLWGGTVIANNTLYRFFVFHFFLPLIALCLSGLHMGFLHRKGSSAPMISSEDYSKISLYPYFFLKDSACFYFVSMGFAYLVFFYPNFLNHADNFIQANTLVTPLHIQPEWYFLPFFCILRSLPSKDQGIFWMTTFILINYFVDAYPDLKRLEKEILDEVNLNESNRSMFIFSEYSLPVTLGCLFLMGFFGMQVQESPYAEVSSFICFFTCAFTNHNFINFYESVFAHRDLRLAREKKNEEDTSFYI